MKRLGQALPSSACDQHITVLAFRGNLPENRTDKCSLTIAGAENADMPPPIFFESGPPSRLVLLQPMEGILRWKTSKGLGNFNDERVCGANVLREPKGSWERVKKT